MIKQLIIFTALSVPLLLSHTTINAADQNPVEESGGGSSSSVWVWADKTDNQHAIFLSRSQDDSWNDVEKISDNEAVNVVPAVTKITDKDLLVVWSAFKNGQSQLLFKFQDEGKWGEETVYYTGLASNTAPSVAVDKEGKAWLVWAGFNGLNDEIYYATWDGSGFDTPTPITNNSVPDILPVIGLDSDTGMPWIQWQQYTPSGYAAYQSFWDDEEWSEPLVVPAKDATDKGDEQDIVGQRNAQVRKTVAAATDEEVQPGDTTTPEVVEIEIPEFVTEPDGASVHLPEQEIQSLPVRSMIRLE